MCKACTITPQSVSRLACHTSSACTNLKFFQLTTCIINHIALLHTQHNCVCNNAIRAVLEEILVRCQLAYTALLQQVSTVVLRASTDNTLDDLERAVDDGVNAYKVSLYSNTTRYLHLEVVLHAAAC